jgi:hypothetical protein
MKYWKKIGFHSKFRSIPMSGTRTISSLLNNQGLDDLTVDSDNSPILWPQIKKNGIIIP